MPRPSQPWSKSYKGSVRGFREALQIINTHYIRCNHPFVHGHIMQPLTLSSLFTLAHSAWGGGGVLVIIIIPHHCTAWHARWTSSGLVFTWLCGWTSFCPSSRLEKLWRRCWRWWLCTYTTLCPSCTMMQSVCPLTRIKLKHMDSMEPSLQRCLLMLTTLSSLSCNKNTLESYKLRCWE